MTMIATGLKDVRTGLLASPDKIVLTGTPGAGKSTWAASAPAPIFLDLEGGTARLNCARVDLQYEPVGAVVEFLDALHIDQHEYRTVVLDTLDALAGKIYAAVCAEERWDSIERPGYAKGERLAVDKFWRPILAKIDDLRIDKGMEAILICHSKVETFKNPIASDYDRWVPKLDKYAMGIFWEWADAVLFAQIEQNVSPLAKGQQRAKATTSGRRLLRTTDGAAWVAKNRYGLPDTLALDYATYAAAREAGMPVSVLALLDEADEIVAMLDLPDDKRLARQGWLAAARANHGGVDAGKLGVAVNRLRVELDAQERQTQQPQPPAQPAQQEVKVA